MVETQAKGLTDQGQVRKNNQDAILLDMTIGLYVVADGMGGHAGGEIASRLCIDTVSEFVDEHLGKQLKSSQPPSCAAVEDTLSAAIQAASKAIYEEAHADPSLHGMGTTATALLMHNGQASFGHVGDSRLYLLRQKLLMPLTQDHSVVEEQIRAGLITEDEAQKHSMRNVITRSVGFQPTEVVDTGSLDIESGDLFMLCSDGLYGKLTPQAMCSAMISKGLAAVKPLVAQANDNGGEDNISCIIVKQR